MSKVIFSDFGIEIIERNSQFFVRYDTGEIVVQFREDEISRDEVSKLQRSAEDAYEVLLACQERQSN